MGDKLRKAMDKYCNYMEMALAVMTGLALLVSAVLFVLSSVGLVRIGYSTEGFSELLNEVFALVVGIEFIQMLLRPSADNVIEVLVFLVTRHMILSHGSALDMLGCVICILLLYSFHFVLHYLKLRNPSLSSSIEKDASNLGRVEEKTKEN